jgi:peptidoglycan-associated lipoprotein
MDRQLKAVAIIMVAALAACTTPKQDEPAAQLSAAMSPSQPELSASNSAPPASGAQRVVPAGDGLRDGPPDRVYFGYDQSDLDPAALDALQKQAAFLARFPNVIVIIEGHSDERGTREYNLALAARRADAVRAYLMTRGISATRLDTVSYGKERPVCAGSDEPCWKLNRRAVSLVNIDATDGRN